MFTPKLVTSTYRLTRRLAYACFAVAALSLAGLLFLAVKVSAQERVCGPTKAMHEFAAKQRNEFPHGAGLVSQNMIIEFLLSEQGTWTILQSFPDGNSCVVAHGAGWQMRAKTETREA